MQKVLVIEDESSVRNILRFNLESRGFEFVEASSGKQGIAKIRETRPNVVVLDLGLPDVAGDQILSDIRSWSKVPVIVLTVEDNEQSKVRLLEAGADDYLTKPFSVPELIARIKVALRHHPEDGAAQPVFESSDLRVDLIDHKVFLEGEEIHLTTTEFHLLRILIRNSGRVVAQDQILREIWGPNAVDNSHYLRIYVGQLRKRIEKDPSNPRHVLTEPGVGYRIV